MKERIGHAVANRHSKVPIGWVDERTGFMGSPTRVRGGGKPQVDHGRSGGRDLPNNLERKSRSFRVIL